MNPLPDDLDILGAFRKRGVTFWLTEGQLHYKAPKGVLTQPQIDQLRAYKSRIVRLLSTEAGCSKDPLKLTARAQFETAPASFSQLAHWNLYRLMQRPAIRQIASAHRLTGALDQKALHDSVATLIRRHDALRTRVVNLNGSLTQKISRSEPLELEQNDLTRIAETVREEEVTRLIEEFIMRPIDVSAGALFGVSLIKLHERDHVLVLALEHMISDGFSLNVLLRELFAAYEQTLKGQAIRLPELPIQFPDYALWQKNSLPAWLERHGAYWAERLRGFRRLEWPWPERPTSTNRPGWGMAPVHIGKPLKAELRRWCSSTQTSLVMCAFAAYAATVLRLCNLRESIFQFVSDGRSQPELHHAIGYFASGLYLRVQLEEEEPFAELVNRVTQEYCAAYEHADSSYFAARTPRPEVAHTPGFNWIPQEFDSQDKSDAALSWRPQEFVHPMAKAMNVDCEPSISLFDTENDGATGAIWFPRARFFEANMQLLGRSFLACLERLARSPLEKSHGAH